MRLLLYKAFTQYYIYTHTSVQSTKGTFFYIEDTQSSDTMTTFQYSFLFLGITA